MSKDIIRQVEGILAPILKRESLELVGVRYIKERGNRILRVYIDKEGGITLKDCENISRELSVLLDVENIIEERYFLEVSSPGIDRPLFKKEDYVRFEGKRAKIRTSVAVEGRKNFSGTLKGIDGEYVIIEIDGREFRIPFENIKKANLIGEVLF